MECSFLITQDLPGREQLGLKLVQISQNLMSGWLLLLLLSKQEGGREEIKPAVGNVIEKVKGIKTKLTSQSELPGERGTGAETGNRSMERSQKQSHNTTQICQIDFNVVTKAGWQKKDELAQQITLGQLGATRKNEPGSKAHTCYKVNVRYTAASNVDSNRRQPLERRVTKIMSTQSLVRSSWTRLQRTIQKGKVVSRNVSMLKTLAWQMTLSGAGKQVR